MTVGLLGATLAFLGMVAASRRVIGWLLVAAAMAGLLHPLVALLQRRLPRGIAVAVVMASLIAGVAGVGYGLVDDIVRQTRHLQTVAPERAADIEASPRFGQLAQDLKLADRTRRFMHSLPERLRGGTPAEALRAAATRAVAFLATGVLTVFLLLHGPRLAEDAARQVHDPERRRRLEEVAVHVYRRSFGYARASLAMAVAAGLVGFAAARLAHVPGPAALGVWVGMWDLVPLAGALIGALPIVVLGATASSARAVALVMVFALYQMAENLVVERQVEARTVRVGPFVTLAAAMVGVEVSGISAALVTVLAATVAMATIEELSRDPSTGDAAQPANAR